MEIQGSKAIVTGISRGIGKAVTMQLLEQGCQVVGWGRTEPDYKHSGLSFIKTNMRSFDSVSEAYEQSMEVLGNQLDILVNNAGLGFFGYLENMPLEEWHNMYETNVNGIFYACKKAIPTMKGRGSGHIVNIASVAALQGSAQIAGYCGTKYAVRGISDSLFKELRDFGIKVTAILPGSTKTDFFDNAPGIDAHDNMMSPDEVAAQIMGCISSSQNFLMSEIVMRPLQPKPKK